MKTWTQAPYTIKYFCKDELIIEWSHNMPPLVPRRAEKIVGASKKYVVTEVVYDFYVPNGTVINVYVEEL